jgi:GDP-L-fucose synthase
MSAKALVSVEGQRVFVAGHKGIVGAAIVRRLAPERCEVLTVDRKSVDLTRQMETESYIAETKPDVVIIAAAQVGGIFANSTFPVEFLADNIAIAQNLMAASHQSNVRKLLFLGSSCFS